MGMWHFLQAHDYVWFLAGLVWLTGVALYDDIRRWTFGSSSLTMSLDSFTENDFTHYNLTIRNNESRAMNLDVWLVSITPRPKAVVFRANYPYRVKSAVGQQSAAGYTIGPGDEHPFELMKSWLGSEGKLMIDGVDTKQESWQAKFSMEDGESWVLRYKIAQANSSPRFVDVAAHKEANALLAQLILPNEDEWSKAQIEKASKGRSAEAVALPQRLTVRILKGYFGVSPNSKSTQVLILEARVDGGSVPAATIKGWKLNLERGGKAWKTAYQQPLSPQHPIRLAKGRKGLVDVEHSLAYVFHEPFDPRVPGRGCLHFTVETADEAFSDLLFGATFILAAVEDQGFESSCKELADPAWLQPAIIVTY